jgi:hypothetical protein
MVMATEKKDDSFRKFRNVLEEKGASLESAVDAFAMIENGEVDISEHYCNNTKHYGKYTPAIWALIYGKYDLANLILNKYGNAAFAIKDEKNLYPIDYLFFDPSENNIATAAKLCSIVPEMCGRSIEVKYSVCRDDTEKQQTCDSIQCCKKLECVTITYSFDEEISAFVKNIPGLAPCGLNIEME